MIMMMITIMTMIMIMAMIDNGKTIFHLLCRNFISPQLVFVGHSKAGQGIKVIKN